MFGLERFASSLGAPETGVHAPRFLGLAAVDLIFAFLLAVALAPFVPGGLLGAAAGVALLGVAAHEVFGVPTALNRRLRGVLAPGPVGKKAR